MKPLLNRMQHFETFLSLSHSSDKGSSDRSNTWHGIGLTEHIKIVYIQTNKQENQLIQSTEHGFIRKVLLAAPLVHTLLGSGLVVWVLLCWYVCVNRTILDVLRLLATCGSDPFSRAPCPTATY